MVSLGLSSTLIANSSACCGGGLKRRPEILDAHEDTLAVLIPRCSACTQSASENMCLLFSSPSTIAATTDLGRLRAGVNAVCKVEVAD